MGEMRMQEQMNSITVAIWERNAVHHFKKICKRATLVVLSSLPLYCLGGTPPQTDVFLRLGDRDQEARTTSVNLIEGNQPAPLKVKRIPSGSAVLTAGLAPLRVVIDAGHGGKDLGAAGFYNIQEKDLCLKVGKMVKRELEKIRSNEAVPLEILLSREDDQYIGLKDRVRYANEQKADYFVSIHANSSPLPRAHGFEVYFLATQGTDEETRRLALAENTEKMVVPLRADVLSILSDVQSNFHIGESSKFAETMFSAISRKILSSGRGVRQGPFTVLNGTAMPAVLIEMGYVTNRLEAQNLTKETYLKRLASAISNGIIEFAAKQKRLG